MLGRAKAEAINQKGIVCQKQGRLREAVELFEKAIALAPRWSTPPYNLGLLFKSEGEWEKSLEYNRLAAKLDPKCQEAWWNMGIAATALGRWEVARSAWRSYGIDVPKGDGPINLPCGFCPIRLNPDEAAEIVWAQRLDPARAELASIPFPESDHRWKDVVLNDGAPVGHRRVNGKDVPVFNELELLEPSPFGTYVARVTMPAGPDCPRQLNEIAARLEGWAEDWSTSVRMLCKACSEGRPHLTHDAESVPADSVHLIGIAARSREHAAKILDDWIAVTSDVHVESLQDALAPA
jgi:hypothetical protein